jgi:hypothetical protein
MIRFFDTALKGSIERLFAITTLPGVTSKEFNRVAIMKSAHFTPNRSSGSAGSYLSYLTM